MSIVVGVVNMAAEAKTLAGTFKRMDAPSAGQRNRVAIVSKKKLRSDVAKTNHEAEHKLALKNTLK